MVDDLTIINSMIGEHKAIRGHLKLLQNSLSTLKNVRTQGQQQSLTEKLRELQLVMCYLEEGLRNHYTHEEKVMAPLLGNPLLEAFQIEHRKVEERFDKAKSLFANLSKKSVKELPGTHSEIKRVIREICELVEDHSLKEDTFFTLLKSALEKKR